MKRRCQSVMRLLHTGHTWALYRYSAYNKALCKFICLLYFTFTLKDARNKLWLLRCMYTMLRSNETALHARWVFTIAEQHNTITAASLARVNSTKMWVPVSSATDAGIREISRQAAPPATYPHPAAYTTPFVFYVVPLYLSLYLSVCLCVSLCTTN